MATQYPTLEELKNSGKDFFTPSDVAGVLGTHPYTINVATRNDPDAMGFPTIRTGEKLTRVKIPKVPFLRKMGVDV